MPQQGPRSVVLKVRSGDRLHLCHWDLRHILAKPGLTH